MQQENKYKNVEKVVVYTEDKEMIAVIPKKNYMGKLAEGFMIKNPHSRYYGKIIKLWLECVTCFIINKENGTIAVQKRAETERDPGQLDLVSGHVRYGELNRRAIQREMREEVAMEGYTDSQLMSNIQFIGQVKADFDEPPIRVHRK